jgi:hypothetical protein
MKNAVYWDVTPCDSPILVTLMIEALRAQCFPFKEKPMVTICTHFGIVVE